MPYITPCSLGYLCASPAAWSPIHVRLQKTMVKNPFWLRIFNSKENTVLNTRWSVLICDYKYYSESCDLQYSISKCDWQLKKEYCSEYSVIRINLWLEIPYCSESSDPYPNGIGILFLLLKGRPFYCKFQFFLNVLYLRIKEHLWGFTFFGDIKKYEK